MMDTDMVSKSNGVVIEQIQDRVRRLPSHLQMEVLDFIEYLLTKSAYEEERDDWSAFSLSAALRGMEEEEEPKYTVEDIKVFF